MQDLIRGFRELGIGSQIFFISVSILLFILILYLVIQSFRHGEF